MAIVTITRLCLVILAATFIGRANSLECYVCRGCAEVTADDIQTCNVPTPAPEVTTWDPVTDQDTVFEDEGIQVAGSKNAPLLNEDENELEGHKGFIVDDSELPGARYFSRGLKQFRDTNSDARCVIAIYNNGDGSPNVVRDCSTASEDNETRCREAVGGSYTGTLQYCNLCDEDLCNSAAKSTLAFIVLLAGVLFNLTYF